jgi:hypothetical protein
MKKESILASEYSIKLLTTIFSLISLKNGHSQSIFQAHQVSALKFTKSNLILVSQSFPNHSWTHSRQNLLVQRFEWHKEKIIVEQSLMTSARTTEKHLEYDCARKNCTLSETNITSELLNRQGSTNITAETPSYRHWIEFIDLI